MNSSQARVALRMLSEIATELEHGLSKHSSTRTQDYDNEADDESPIFDSFYATGGNESIMKMPDFTAPEFRKLYSILKSCITTNWNNGFGKRSDSKQVDVLFTLSVVMKQKSSWD